jgi:hydrogenase nickel incorporation protein HypA/HybF
MHEISLVRNIFNTLEAEFPDRFGEIRTIYLTVGELSNVQPILMQNAFDAVVQDEPRYKNTVLKVQVLPIKIHCNQCGKESIVEQYKFICNFCQTPSKQVIQGEELLISKVEFIN